MLLEKRPSRAWLTPRRRALLAVWAPGLALVAVMLAAPVVLGPLVARMNPNAERQQVAREVERVQRSQGVPTVLPSGEVVNAVVVTPASPRPRKQKNMALVWWYRIIAGVAGLGMLVRTRRILRQPEPPLPVE